MAWQTLDRVTPVVDEKAPPALSEAVREKIRAFFPKYETKRAVLLPALHIVQHTNGHISPKAMMEIAELLEIPPSSVLDTLSFYTHFWDHPKGKKVIVACRSLSCHIMGAGAVTEAIKSELKVSEHGTTKDGQYSFMTEECLAACDFAPCLLINEKLHKNVKPDDVAKLLKDGKNDQVAMPRSDLFDPPAEKVAKPATTEPAAAIGKTSDIQEMKEA